MKMILHEEQKCKKVLFIYTLPKVIQKEIGDKRHLAEELFDVVTLACYLG